MADASLARDQIVKVPLYARAAIPEVWIVNLPGRRIEVFRQPAEDGYREMRLIDDGTLSPTAFPKLARGVAKLIDRQQ